MDDVDFFLGMFMLCCVMLCVGQNSKSSAFKVPLLCSF